MFSERVRALRMKRGMTQQNMADALDVSLNAYQKYEQAERFPPFEKLGRLCDLLGCSADYLLGHGPCLQGAFPQRLNEARKAKGFTAQEMADLLAVSLRTYRNYESGHSAPSLETLVRIADILGVTTDDLLRASVHD